MGLVALVPILESACSKSIINAFVKISIIDLPLLQSIVEQKSCHILNIEDNPNLLLCVEGVNKHYKMYFSHTNNMLLLEQFYLQCIIICLQYNYIIKMSIKALVQVKFYHVHILMVLNVHVAHTCNKTQFSATRKIKGNRAHSFCASHRFCLYQK